METNDIQAASRGAKSDHSHEDVSAHDNQVEQTGQESAQLDPDDKRYLRPLPLMMLFLATSLTGSLVLMYALIIATAIPSITAAFNTIEDLDWYSTAYLFATCSVQPLVAKLYDLFRLRDVYVASIVLFEVGNVICGAAQTSAVFIGGRTVAGLGAAGLFSGGLVMLTVASPPKWRAPLIGGGMGLMIVGGALGPLIGGALTQHLGWRWCMWIFLPPGGVSAVAFLFLRVPEQRKKAPAKEVLPILPKAMDLIGFALFAPAVIMLLLAFSWGGGRYACVFRKKVVFCGCAVAFLQVGAFATLGDYLPLWFQSVKGATPTTSGLNILPTMITQLLATGFCALCFNKLGYAPLWAQTGNVLAGLGSGLMTTFNPSTPTGQWIGYQILVGIGRGFVIQIPPIALQNTLQNEELATGTALLIFFQYFGSSVFLCVSKTAFLNRLIPALQEHVPDVDPQAIINAGATDLENIVDGSEYNALIQAYSDALVTTFWLSAAASIIAFFFSFGLGWRKVELQTKKMMGNESEAKDGEPVTAPPKLQSQGHGHSGNEKPVQL
uniref:Major facilitator superfamily transporter n=1 Tax=Colletotrichum fructicola (strain Nara gc5) TaxID=1213859 RepID=L2FKG8_COLFN